MWLLQAIAQMRIIWILLKFKFFTRSLQVIFLKASEITVSQKEKPTEGNSFDGWGIVSLSKSFHLIILQVVLYRHWAMRASHNYLSRRTPRGIANVLYEELNDEGGKDQRNMWETAQIRQMYQKYVEDM